MCDSNTGLHDPLVDLGVVFLEPSRCGTLGDSKLSGDLLKGLEALAVFAFPYVVLKQRKLYLAFFIGHGLPESGVDQSSEIRWLLR